MFSALSFAIAALLALIVLILGLRQQAGWGRSLKNAGLLGLLWSLPAGVLLFSEPSWAVLTVPVIAGGWTLLFFRRPKQLLRQTPVPLGAPELEARIQASAAHLGVHNLELARLPTGAQLGVHAFAANLSRPLVILADGLLHRLDEDEQHALACHELGHHSSGSLWWLLAPWPLGAALAFTLLPSVREVTVIGLAFALGFFGSRVWVSRPVELLCDRIAAQATEPATIRSALTRLHALHPVPLEGWLGPLAYLLATHPPLPIRLQALGEEQPLAVRHRVAHLLGNLVLLGTLGLLVASEVNPFFFLTLAAVPPFLLALGARRALKQGRGRQPVSWVQRYFIPGLLVFIALAVSVILGSVKGTLSSLWLVPTLVAELLVVVFAIRFRRTHRLRKQIQEAVHRRDFAWVWGLWAEQGARISKEPSLAHDVLVCGWVLGEVGTDRDLLALCPRFPQAGLSLSSLSLFRTPELAAQAAQAVIQALPNDHAGYVCLGRARLEQGDLEGAREAAEQARAADDDPLIGALEAWIQVRSGELESAKALLEEVELERPGDPWAQLIGLELALESGDTEAASEDLLRLERAVADMPVHGFGPALERLRARATPGSPGAAPSA